MESGERRRNDLSQVISAVPTSRINVKSRKNPRKAMIASGLSLSTAFDVADGGRAGAADAGAVGAQNALVSRPPACERAPSKRVGALGLGASREPLLSRKRAPRGTEGAPSPEKGLRGCQRVSQATPPPVQKMPKRIIFLPQDTPSQPTPSDLSRNSGWGTIRGAVRFFAL